jgi:hypothetical protein
VCIEAHASAALALDPWRANSPDRSRRDELPTNRIHDDHPVTIEVSTNRRAAEGLGDRHLGR